MPKKKSKAVSKKAAKTSPAKKKAVKTTPAKKAPAKKSVKKTVAKKKAATKKKAAAAAKRPAAPKKATPKKKSASKKTSANKKGKKKPSVEGSNNGSKPAVVSRSEVSSEGSKSTPIVFSLDDVEELMASKQKTEKASKTPAKKATAKAPAKKTAQKKTVVEDAPSEKRVLGAASLADILGFNPAEKQKSTDLSESEIPKKWKKYYKLLVQLRAHVSDEISLHTSDTLKHSSREDSGDLSSYGNHQADAGTDTFDRDFALSLVSSEQEALKEIEEAILRIKDGSYGVCEVTGKSIPAARLTAVPFARYSVEGQAEYEKNRRHKADRTNPGGLFADSGDAPKITSSDDDDD